MKRLVGFLVTLFLLDRLVGAGLAYAATRAFDGWGYGAVNSSLAATSDHDVILLGSSTTRHGYDPRILADALGRPVYNAGEDGMDYDFDYGLMHLMVQHGHPKLWVVTLDDPNKLVEPGKTAAMLAPNIADDPVVKELVLHAGPTRLDGLKYLSQTMRYNGKVIGIARDILVHPVHTIEGYEPLENSFPPEAQAKALTTSPFATGGTPDSYQLNLLRGMANFARAQGGQVVFVLPPYYTAPGSRQRGRVVYQRLAQELGVPLLEYTADTNPLWRNPAFFADAGHLNPRGATELSHLLAQDLKRFLPPL